MLVDKGTFRLPADSRACYSHTCCMCIIAGLMVNLAPSGWARLSIRSRLACRAEQCMDSWQDILMLTWYD